MIKAIESVIGILAHVDAGKTTLTEAILYKTGAIRRLGRVDKKDSWFDSHELERSRGITIFSKQNPFRIGEKRFTLIDTPGHVDFSAEMERTLGVLDYAVLVIDGTSGVQSHTETIWQLLKEYKIPVFIFVNKADREGFDGQNMIKELKSKLGEGCVDFSLEEDKLNEEISMLSEELLEAYLSGESDDEFLKNSISRLVAGRELFPCFFGSALFDRGVDALLDGIEKYTLLKDYPEDFGAYAYKILHDSQGNRISFLKITGGSLSVKMPLGGEKSTKSGYIRAKNLKPFSQSVQARSVPSRGLKAFIRAKRSIKAVNYQAESRSSLPCFHHGLSRTALRISTPSIQS